MLLRPSFNLTIILSGAAPLLYLSKTLRDPFLGFLGASVKKTVLDSNYLSKISLR